MNSRAYTLIDFEPPPALRPDDDLLVRFLEHVRARLHTIVPGVPARCEVDLIAAGYPHGAGAVPRLGLYEPPDLAEPAPGWQDMIATVSAWCASLSAADVRSIASATDAPTWQELQELGVYPARDRDG